MSDIEYLTDINWRKRRMQEAQAAREESRKRQAKQLHKQQRKHSTRKTLCHLCYVGMGFGACLMGLTFGLGYIEYGLGYGAVVLAAMAGAQYFGR